MRTPDSSQPALFRRMFSFTVQRHCSFRLQIARAEERERGERWERGRREGERRREQEREREKRGRDRRKEREGVNIP